MIRVPKISSTWYMRPMKSWRIQKSERHTTISKDWQELEPLSSKKACSVQGLLLTQMRSTRIWPSIRGILGVVAHDVAWKRRKRTWMTGVRGRIWGQRMRRLGGNSGSTQSEQEKAHEWTRNNNLKSRFSMTLTISSISMTHQTTIQPETTQSALIIKQT